MNGLLWLIVIVNILTLVLLAVFVALSWDVITAENDQEEAGQQQQPQPGGGMQGQGKCGDGVCDGPETPQLCPEDCQ
ncbi:MAG: hypothetical protein ISS88_01975 [Candidatus Portnoybacteria bacterium]|nr:hypothetical protein [Candidatus Portnoybacteria bacterium]